LPAGDEGYARQRFDEEENWGKGERRVRQFRHRGRKGRRRAECREREELIIRVVST